MSRHEPVHFSLSQTTAPATEPLGLQEAKDHLRVDSTDDDALIDTLVLSARQWIETQTRRALITQIWDLKLDKFPWEIRVPLPPLQSVGQITYIDTAGGSPIVLATTEYQVDANSLQARIRPAAGVTTWPATDLETLGAVTVSFTTGYGAAGDIPEPIKQAMKLLLGHLYERREQSIVGAPIAEIPMGIRALIGPYEVPAF